MKRLSETRTLIDTAKEFLAFKKAQKAQERTLKDYQKYILPGLNIASIVDVGLMAVSCRARQ